MNNLKFILIALILIIIFVNCNNQNIKNKDNIIIIDNISNNKTVYNKINDIRYIDDNFLLNNDELKLLQTMLNRSFNIIYNEDDKIELNKNGGPTILDINSGYARDSIAGLRNIYSLPSGNGIKFSIDEYKIYEDIFNRLRLKVMKLYNLKNLYFTAPTFTARILGNENYKPKSMHDEYYHAHIDKFNTEHYDYSALIYLTDYNKDFTGGEFEFIDDNDIEVNNPDEIDILIDDKYIDNKDNKNRTIVYPKAGRFITFKSDNTNIHRVNKVKSGYRTTISCWFTLNKKYEFSNFLDGEVHSSYQKLKIDVENDIDNKDEL